MGSSRVRATSEAAARSRLLTFEVEAAWAIGRRRLFVPQLDRPRRQARLRRRVRTAVHVSWPPHSGELLGSSCAAWPRPLAWARPLVPLLSDLSATHLESC